MHRTIQLTSPTSAPAWPVQPDLPFGPHRRLAASTSATRPPGPVRAKEIQLLGTRITQTWLKGHVFADPLPSGRDAMFLAAAMTDVSLSEAVALVAAHLADRHDLTEQNPARMLTEIGRFITGLELAQVKRLSEVTPLHCEDFIDRAVQTSAGAYVEPSPSTMYTRRTSVRVFYGVARHLLLTREDPTVDIKLPPRSTLAARPLDHDEQLLGEVWALQTLTDTRQPTAWALGQATATPTEQALATVRNLDVDNQRIWLCGNEKKREPRWGYLTPWGLARVEERLEIIGSDPDMPLVTAASASLNAKQSSASSAIAEVMKRAGLRRNDGIRPSSLPAWAGVQVHNATGRIEEVAKALGVRDLERAAAIIGWKWRD